MRPLIIFLLLFASGNLARATALPFQKGDVVALVGGGNLERTRFAPYLQANLLAAPGAGPIKVRNLAWEGDTVYEQWRDVNFPSIARQLDQIGATVVIAQFGQMESLQGEERLPEFVAAYEKLVSEIQNGSRRVALASPTPFENPGRANLPDLTPHNAAARAYTAAIAKLAAKHGLDFVDLFTPMASDASRGALTEDGLHLTDAGQAVAADEITRQLGAPPRPRNAALLAAALDLERLWFNDWRTANWAFLEGDRTSVAFSHDWRDASKRIFPDEMNEFPEILAEADANIARALSGQPVKPIEARSNIPKAPPTVKAETPEEELATLDIDPDYAVNLFASEKDGVGKVVQIRWDEKGRLWALCIPDYPQIKPGAKSACRLVICEDTYHSGRADRFTTFADGLEMPLGFELGDGGVYLAAGPDLWFLRDTTGGDHANERRLVLGGFGTGDTHQTINSLSWGFGGELWFSQGHSIFSRVETPYGVERHDRAGLWRLRPRSGHLDTFFGHDGAGANNWGVLTDPLGQVFHKEGAGNGGYYSVPGLVRTDLAVNSVPMNIFRSRTKTVGFDLVQTRHFPESLQGCVVIGGVYDNSLQLHRLSFENGMYQTKLETDIIRTKNSAFRPCDVRFGPDGAIYFADWYNTIVGHYQASYRDPNRDLAHGRIWRVTRKDRPLVEPPVLAGASNTALFEQLDSPERWAQYQAKRLLFSRKTSEVTADLDRWVAALPPGAKDDYRRLQALAIYEAHETPRPALLKALLRAADPRIRAYATRSLSTWARDGAFPEALSLLETQIADPDSTVRLEAIVAASYVPDARAAVVAARALDHECNAYHRHALAKTLDATSASWAPALAAGTLKFDRDEHLLFALTNARLENTKMLVRREIERHEGDAAWQKMWLPLLAKIGARDDLQFVLERAGRDPEILDALLASPESRTQTLDAAAPALRPLLDAANEAAASRAMRLAGLWRVHSLADRIAQTAGDDAASPVMRVAAISALGDLGGAGAREGLLKLLENTKTPRLRSAVLEALATADPASAADQVVKDLEQSKTAAEAAALLRPVLSRAEGSPALMKRLGAAPAISPRAARLALSALNQIGRNDQILAPVLMRAAGINSSLPPYTKEVIAAVVQQAKLAGDAAEGRKFFETLGCIGCHAVNNVGGRIGPDLSVVGRGLPIDMIVTEVLWPAINVKEGYEAATATMRDGTVVTGFKQADTAEAIAIRDMNTNAITTIRRADAKEIQTGGTVMPDGLTAPLSPKELGSLIRYLSELGR